MYRNKTGIIYICQKSIYVSDNDNKENVYITIGYTLRKNLRKCHNILAIHRIYSCRNTTETYKKIRNDFESVYGDPISRNITGYMDYCVYSIQSAIVVFDAIIHDYIPFVQKMYKTTIKNTFPNYRKDISFMGNKRLAKIFWTENKIHFIENQKIITEPISDFVRLCTINGYYSVDNYRVIAKEGEVIDLKGGIVNHINKRKLKIILNHEEKSLYDLITNFRDIVLYDEGALSTKYFIDNILFKNGIISIKKSDNSDHFIYCIIDIDKKNNKYVILIDSLPNVITYDPNIANGSIYPNKIIKFEVININGYYYEINYAKNNGLLKSNNSININDLCLSFDKNIKI